MYLSHLTIHNFRIFGGEGNHLDLTLQPGLNLLVGENNSGKSALMDAIRLLLGTRDEEVLRITLQDFHHDGTNRADTFTISGTFDALDTEEASEFLEWLTVDTQPNGEARYRLHLTLQATRKEKPMLQGRFDRMIHVEVRAGTGEDGRPLEGTAREHLKVTYLKPLRDAEREMAARKGSRLSQILSSHDDIDEHEASLLSIMETANTGLRDHEMVERHVNHLNNTYLQHLKLANDPFQARISVAPMGLRGILERLALSIAEESLEDARHGLGLDNLLFVAAEFLLLQGPQAPLRLALIEEPEAHLHPQLQLRLVEFLEERLSNATDDRCVQVLLSSHSTHLASKIDLRRTVVVHKGQVFSLSPEETLLAAGDYLFLRQFLDATRSNLFFARGVLIVEGPAEQLLLPVLAELLGRSFTHHGVSIVNVGGIGLFRYARIFQRRKPQQMDVRVACLGDFDVPPDEAKTPASGLPKIIKKADTKTFSDYTPEALQERRRAIKARAEGGSVQVFVSPWWTLEYDLARGGFARELFIAAELVKADQSLTPEECEPLIMDADALFEQQKRNLEAPLGRSLSDIEVACWVYHKMRKKKTDTAYFLGMVLRRKYQEDEQSMGPSIARRHWRHKLPEYLVDAIDHVTRHVQPTAEMGLEEVMVDASND